MSLNQAEVAKVAQLARLEFNPDQAIKLTGELSGLVDYVQELAQAPTTDEKVSAPITGLKNIARIDTKSEGLVLDQVFLNAPAKKDNFILVKKVFE